TVELFDELALRAEIQKHVLTEQKLIPSEVRDANEKDVRARAAREASCFRIKEQNVLPSVRRYALEPEVRHEKRVARSPPDDLESELVECDPPSQIVHEWRERRSATASRTSVPRA